MLFKRKIIEQQLLEYFRLYASDRFKSLIIYSLGGLDALCASKGVKKETTREKTIFTKKNISLSRHDRYYLNFDDYLDAFKELERLIELDRDLEKIGIRPTQQKNG